KTLEQKIDHDFRPLGFSASGKVNAPLVFAGYGITYKDKDKTIYDDYQGLDVAGKIVVVLRKTPPKGKDGKAFAGGGHTANVLGSLTNKVVTAAAAKARGLLIVNDRDTAEKGDHLIPFEYTSRDNPPADIPSANITRALADALLSGAAKNLKDIEEQINRTVEPKSVALGYWTARLSVAIARPEVELNNVIGIRQGTGPLASEYVIIGAHYDHLGRGERGS